MFLSGLLNSCVTFCGSRKTLLIPNSSLYTLTFYALLLLILTQIVSCGGGGGGSSSNGDTAGPTPVFIQLSPVNPQIALGTTVSIKATAVYADNSRADVTEQVTWTLAGGGEFVFINNASGDKGRAYSLRVGSASVVATLSGKQASTNVVVERAQLLSLELSARDVQLPIGTKKTVTVMARYSNDIRQDVTWLATWSTTDALTATVNSGDVVTVEGVAVGETELTATLDGISTRTGISVTSATLQSLTIEPFQPRLSVGLHIVLDVFARYSDGTFERVSDQVSWASSNVSLASVSNDAASIGDVTANSTGNVTLTASLQGISASTEMTITDAVLEDIMVSPSPVSMAKGTRQPLSATGFYSDNSVKDITTQVIWSTSDGSIVDVANAAGTAGLVSALEIGDSQVHASLNGVDGHVNVTVNEAALLSINITPLSPVIAAGARLQLSAIGNYSDGATQVLTQLVGWNSNNTDVATVTNAIANPPLGAKTSEGLVVANVAGNATISANYAGVSGSVALTVTDAALTSIDIDQNDLSLARGTAASLSATAHFSDGSTLDYTQQLTWESSAPTIAQVSNTANNKARVEAFNNGTSTITASLTAGFVNADSITLMVTDAVLDTITVSPQNAAITNNTTLQFSATGHFSDGTEQDMTQQVSWESSNSTLVAMSNAIGSRGLASGVIIDGAASNDVTITAHYVDDTALVQASANLSVSFVPEKPISLVVSASPNVLLSNDTDASELTISVRAAAENATVDDGTILDVEILQGGAVLGSSSVSTFGGIAIVSLSDAQAGLLVLRVTLNGTQISNTVSVLVVSSFEEAVLDVSRAIATVDIEGEGEDRVVRIRAGSKFLFYITNNSNRDFDLKKYEFLNGGVVVGVPETNPENLNEGKLPGGATVGIVAVLTDDLVDMGTSSRFTLVDPVSGVEFTMSTTYSVVP